MASASPLACSKTLYSMTEPEALRARLLTPARMLSPPFSVPFP